LAQTAQNYANKKGYTLSNLIENYLLTLVKIEEINETTGNTPIANDKQESVDAFLNYASKNRKIEKEFKFNREQCYDR